MENNKKLEELLESVKVLNNKLNELMNGEICDDNNTDTIETNKKIVLLNDLRKKEVIYTVTTSTMKNICEANGIKVYKVYDDNFNGLGYRLGVLEKDVNQLLGVLKEKSLLKDDDRVYLFQLEPISNFSVEIMEEICKSLNISIRYEKTKRGRCKHTIRRDDVLKLLGFCLQ